MLKGSWEGTVQSDFGPLALTVTYSVDGDALTGTLATQWGQVSFSDGRIKGGEFEHKFDVMGRTYEHKGTLINDDGIRITSTGDDGRESQFTLSRRS